MAPLTGAPADEAINAFLIKHEYIQLKSQHKAEDKVLGANQDPVNSRHLAEKLQQNWFSLQSSLEQIALN